MTYREVLLLLKERGNEVKGIHLGLRRIGTLLDALGNPHLAVPVLHITGTNGKGSVAAMAESVLRQAGWKTGMYTSPHLVRLQERIRVNGREIPRRRLAAHAGLVHAGERELLEERGIDRPLTYFEFVTACAFLHFADERVDVAVVEVGMGGRLDATNVVAPRTCVITGVSYDHQDLLGHTLAQIAGEKAGIIKTGVPVVYASSSPAVLRVIRRTAKRRRAARVEYGRDVLAGRLRGRRGRYTFDLRTPSGSLRGLRLSLAGKHQVRNASLAVAAVQQMTEGRIGIEAIRRGLASTRWPGRLDEYRSTRRTLLDGAHNVEGAAILREYLRQAGEQEIHLVFGALADKEIRKMARILFPLAQSIHLAALENTRGADPAEVRRAAGAGASCLTYPGAADALRGAWSRCSRRGLVVVAGSLYLVGELLPLVSQTPRRLS